MVPTLLLFQQLYIRVFYGSSTCLVQRSTSWLLQQYIPEVLLLLLCIITCIELYTLPGIYQVSASTRYGTPCAPLALTVQGRPTHHVVSQVLVELLALILREELQHPRGCNVSHADRGLPRPPRSRQSVARLGHRRPGVEVCRRLVKNQGGLRNVSLFGENFRRPSENPIEAWGVIEDERRRVVSDSVHLVHGVWTSPRGHGMPMRGRE